MTLLGDFRWWLKSEQAEYFVRVGGFVVALAMLYTMVVVHWFPNFEWWQIAPAGIVANFFFPVWIVAAIGYVWVNWPWFQRRDEDG